jgi:8-oxo-dGTP pyrophosphatase MutT (NUDIX family)
MARHDQVAAIPVRKSAAGQLEVLLVTTRETQRWVVPKGWPLPRRPDHEAAAVEAWEEAGVRGTIEITPVGTFDYEKRQKSGLLPVRVSAFVMEVTEEASTWPEAAQRRRAWFSAEDASEAVTEDGLKDLLRGLCR